MTRFMKVVSAVAWLLAALPGVALASQGSCVLPTSGTVSGLTLVQDINTCNEALLTSNSGATAPANSTGGAPSIGQVWLDTSASPNPVRIYDGASWLIMGYLDAASHVWTPPVGGGTDTVASATTTDLCSKAQAVLSVSGTTTISSFSNTCQPGQIKALRFPGVLTLTYNATSMILPGGASITTAAGDQMFVAYLGSGNWTALAYQRADGTALSFSSVFTGAVFFSSPVSATVSGNTNDWAPGGSTPFASANVVRLTCSSTANITGMVAPAIDGKVVLVASETASTNNCTMTVQDTGSSAANRFLFDRAMTLRPGRSIALRYDSSASRWKLFQEVTSQPVAGGFKALAIVNGGTPNNQMTATADQITVEDTSGGAARLSAVSVTPDVTASGANGLDTGTVTSNQWYSIWVIYNPTTGTTAGLFSTSATAPTMPAGYTYKARVGWNRTDGSSHFYGIVQSGRRAQYTAVRAAVTSVNTAGAATALAVVSYVPSTAGVIKVNLQGPNNLSSQVGVGPNSSPTSFAYMTAGSVAISAVLMPVEIALESSSIYYYSLSTTTSIGVLGWEDNL